MIFLVMMVAPALIQTVAELESGERPGVLDVFLMSPTAPNLHEYEHSLERSSLVVKQLRPWTQYIQWKFLADAGENTVLGREDWLFYRPSVRYGIEHPSNLPETGSAEPLPSIQSFHDQLQAHGIRLLVVPVPNKESVYPEMLAKRAEGAGVLICEPTRSLLDQLSQCGIEIVDLFEVFRRAKQERNPSDSNRLYLAQDSHWSPRGARLAAEAVARRVLEGDAVGEGDHAFIERAVTVNRQGDLVQMLQVPQIERTLEPEKVVCQQVVQSGTKSLYRDVKNSEVLILGDSFLRIYEEDEPGAAGFIAHLARLLRQPLTSIVNDGGASTLVRQELARRPALLMKKRLVIWEFAEREIRYGTEGWQILPLAQPKVAPR
jgi:hypothetical protein